MIKYEELEKILIEPKKVPYPTVPRLPKNKVYAQMIYDSFAGETGEFTALSQYIYEHIELKQQHQFGNILMDIAIDEMKHLDILRRNYY